MEPAGCGGQVCELVDLALFSGGEEVGGEADFRGRQPMLARRLRWMAS
jgi:hypothetical protein